MDINKVIGPMNRAIADRIKDTDGQYTDAELVDLCLEMGLDIFYNPSQEMLDAGWVIPTMDKKEFAAIGRPEIETLIPLALAMIKKDTVH